MHRIHATLRIAAALLAAGIAAHAAADSIVLRTSVRLADRETAVRLRDVAYLDGDAATRLGSVQLADLDGGTSVELSLEEIRAKLVAVDRMANLVDFSGKSVTVRSATAGRPVAMKGLALDASPSTRPAEQMAARTADAQAQPIEFVADDAVDVSTPRGLIAELMRNAHRRAGCRVRLTIAGCDAAFLDQRASGARRYEVLPLTSLTVDVVRLRVVARDGDEIVSRTELRVQPMLEAPVARATSQVRRGATVGSSVEVANEWVHPSEFDSIAPSAAISSSVATSTIAKGERVAQNDVRRPIEVHRNDKVTIRRELAGAAIELTAIADEDGAVGELIRFRAVDRKDRRDTRTFLAEIVGHGRAVMREESKTAAAGETSS